MTPERIAEIRKLLAEATPRPWYYNSYSMVQAGGALLDAWEAAGDEADYPLSDEGDRAWRAKRDRAYALDIRIASVPALYGDTAEGRHAADADLIAQAPDIIEELLAELEMWRSVENAAKVPISGEM